MRFPNMVPRIQFAWWETLIMRAGFAWILVREFPRLARLPTFEEAERGLPFPNGLAKFFDLSWVLVESNFEVLQLVMMILCGLYALGIAFPIVCSALFVVYALPPTLQNSLGSISHYYQMMVLLLLFQALAAWVWTIRKHGLEWRSFVLIPSDLHSFVIRVTIQVVAANYVLCGITKLLNSDFKWLWKSRYMPLQIEKIERQHYFNRLEAPDMGMPGRVAQWVVDHPWLCIVFYGPGLIFELIAFLMLFGRAWAFWIGLLTLLMHRVILLTMRLNFEQHEGMVLLFLMNVPFWIVFWSRRGAIKAGFLKPDAMQGATAPGK